MYARPSAKLVPVGSREAFDGLLAEGAGFAGFAAGEIGQVPSDPDIAAIPDLASYTPVPWQGIWRVSPATSRSRASGRTARARSSVACSPVPVTRGTSSRWGSSSSTSS